LAPPVELDAELVKIQRQIALERARSELRKLQQPPPEAGAGGLPPLPALGAGGGPGAGHAGRGEMPLPAAEHPWLPIAIYGIDGRLKARVRAKDGETLADVAPGDELPDGVRIVAITPERVSFSRGRSGGATWSLAVLKYDRGAFQSQNGLPGGAP
jgi:type IV pilus biogenesis protein PilP